MLNLLADTAPALTLRLPPYKHVRLTLVGCGGTGSHLASGLATLVGELVTRNIECALTLIDGDTVEAKNVGRQLFAKGDIGKHKSKALTHRLMQSFGLPVLHRVTPIDERDIKETFVASDAHTLNLVVGAVDNPAARTVIAQAVDRAAGNLWWLDCGNERHSGQVCIGNAPTKQSMRGGAALGMIERLPAPHVVYPDLIAVPKAKKLRSGASCAELTTAGEQGLMVNRMVAAHALTMLDAFLRGDLRYFALAFDAVWGGASPLVIDQPTLSRVCGVTV
jgi:PRTRC genetic system ThiF family protein